MSKRQKVTFKDLTEKERLTLCAVAEAIGRKDKRVNIYISKKTVDVSVAPRSEEQTSLF